MYTYKYASRRAHCVFCVLVAFRKVKFLTGFSAVYFVCIFSDSERHGSVTARRTRRCSVPRVRVQRTARAGRQPCNSRCRKRRLPFRGMRLYLPIVLIATPTSTPPRVLFRGAGAAAKLELEANVKMYCI